MPLLKAVNVKEIITQTDNNMTNDVQIPTRGLLGFCSEFMTATKGLGTANYVFDFMSICPIKTRHNGVLVCKENVQLSHLLYLISRPWEIILGPGIDVYEGQIIGENAREEDGGGKPAKGKKPTIACLVLMTVILTLPITEQSNVSLILRTMSY